MKKQIISVSCEGIDYLDEQGNPQYVDFQGCFDTWVGRQNSRTYPYYDERSREIDLKWKRVGQRDYSAKPPYIEFFTTPITRFEFDTMDAFHQLQSLVQKAGWRTIDLA